MKVIIARNVSSTTVGVTESLSTQISRVEASSIVETTDTDGDKCYSITYSYGVGTQTTDYKQKDYIIAVMGG